MTTEVNRSEIQGLILSGYGHLNYGKYLFLTVTDAAQGRAWIGAIQPLIANGERWDSVNEVRVKPTSMINIGISASGLRALGVSDTSLETFPVDYRDGIATEIRSNLLGDQGASAPANWQIGKDQSTLHVLLVILAQDALILAQRVAEQQTLWQAHGLSLLAEEHAQRLPDNREHFGFKDGISQPKFKGNPRKDQPHDPEIKPGEFVLGYPNNYDTQPIMPELNGRPFGLDGSYVVFRKMYQDVVGFWEFMTEQANNPSDAQLMAMSPELRVTWFASKMYGRWPSGAPMTKYPDHDVPDLPKEALNKFLYVRDRPTENAKPGELSDAQGLYAPRGSHIRRANPRDTNADDPNAALKTSDSHLIIRRGLPYGQPLVTLDNIPPLNLVEDHQDRGLIFLAINASISRQFEFIHQSWLNNTKFDHLYNDKDPIVGDNPDKTDVDPETERYDMTIERLPVRRRIKNMPRFTTVRGGGYFFMPSLSALNMLAKL
ncbi:MAG: Dyp-type peroxidase [Armatimonadetes bacterium]|nr:Dyp-type peroxidase [Anaerolineae bacterium]